MIIARNLFSVREASKGFIISLRASNRYSPGYLTVLEAALAMLADFAEENRWPGVVGLTTAHLEDYLGHFASRRKWYGEYAPKGPVSQSYLETQYRRLKRFFNWLVSRDHIEKNPLDLIPHPKVEERVIPTVSAREAADLLALVDPRLYTSPGLRFRAIRNRALLCILIDTPARKGELAGMTVSDVDLDAGRVLVVGKGARERWMHLGSVTSEALWEYLQLRASVVRRTDALWVDRGGEGMGHDWLRGMLHRLGRRAGIRRLHPHMFRHTFAIAWLRAEESERVLMLEGGWKNRIPPTYFRTHGEEEAARAHQRMSPTDRLGQETGGHQGRGERRGQARGRL